MTAIHLLVHCKAFLLVPKSWQTLELKGLAFFAKKLNNIVWLANVPQQRRIKHYSKRTRETHIWHRKRIKVMNTQSKYIELQCDFAIDLVFWWWLKYCFTVSTYGNVSYIPNKKVQNVVLWSSFTVETSTSFFSFESFRAVVINKVPYNGVKSHKTCFARIRSTTRPSWRCETEIFSLQI